MKYCTKCGEKLFDNNLKFCLKCGTSLVVNEKNIKPKFISRKPVKIVGVVVIIVLTVILGKSVFDGRYATCNFEEVCSFDNFDMKISNLNHYKKGMSLNVEIMNKTANTYPITYSDFLLIDNEEISSSGVMTMDDDALSFDSIPSGTKKHYVVYFDKLTYYDIKEVRFQGINDRNYTIKFDGKQISADREKQVKEQVEKEENEREKVANRIREDELLKGLNNSFNIDGIKYTLETLPKYDSEVINTVKRLNQNQISKYILDGAQKAYDDGIKITSDLINVLRDEESELKKNQREKEQVAKENRLFTKEEIVSSINYDSKYFEHGRYYTVDDIPDYSDAVNKKAVEMRSNIGRFTKYTLDKLQEIYENGGDINTVSIDSILEEERSNDNSKEVKAKMVKEGIDIETGVSSKSSNSTNNFSNENTSQCMYYDPKADLTYYSDEVPKKGNHCMDE